MVVVVLTACPQGLRGDLTRWLLEISSGVYVGHISARVRDRLWERIKGQIRSGKAIMVFSARNEQHLSFRVHRSDWTPVQCDGLELIKRPSKYQGKRVGEQQSVKRSGWSKASRYRRAHKFAK